MASPRCNFKPKIRRFLRETPRLTLAPIVVGVVALALYILGMVPAHMQGFTGAATYASIAQAESKLGFEIAVPAYFPIYLAWPPAKITGQLEPFPMAQMLFLSHDRSSEVLLIYQIASDSKTLPIALPWTNSISQEVPVDLNGNQGKLFVGKKEDGQQVNGVYWKADDFYFIVVTTHHVRELLTMARSMLQ